MLSNSKEFIDKVKFRRHHDGKLEPFEFEQSILDSLGGWLYAVEDGSDLADHFPMLTEVGAVRDKILVFRISPPSAKVRRDFSKITLILKDFDYAVLVEATDHDYELVFIEGGAASLASVIRHYEPINLIE